MRGIILFTVSISTFQGQVTHRCTYLTLNLQVRLIPCRIDKADEQYKNEFNDELKRFKERIICRAQEKLDAAVKEIEENEKRERLGPGGLDPVEVFETLPPVRVIEMKDVTENTCRATHGKNFTYFFCRNYKNVLKRKIFPYCNKLSRRCPKKRQRII